MFERFTKSARIAVVLAQEEARDAGADRITPTHLLLGVLDCADDDLKRELTDVGLTTDAVRASDAGRVITEGDAAALKGIGIDVGAIADAVSSKFGFDILRPIRKRFATGHIPFAPGSKKSLQLALRESTHRKDRSIGAAHVLLGVMRSDDEDALAAIASAIAPTELRQRLYDLLDRPAA
ncbi:Clp domain protein OS=Tsukamurella paurometabola (strain ATCC 8368 / DSM / CCUG 35730 / CIP 100753 / JCM 10117 / KCTC 9821 / NBRC 16120 / NCIMB 702349 /NCTC 13040) OX=521096 GN=Tpau_3155 PE=4 SV=1 [Tsukamurella paurometabola]|uniref:Clp domain protein n=1 Tax=Tsukamurella paurometabola (strain ATCC 8368 / DSM 20162 / CCUG 35730 / CIP 100753 / JCM 10117 / KCTC 9821 / NBRC 16120 / NCIMB 702349 / NCTC 13040) TaxID=521096 RepID=D5UV24_TSUPD|nr:Clp protease N-terminal domain-containing protein [Tsukamurella paurometabola]ADG79742.1 Clp domain protein [Tsukamurella paurometabola DSM 20162]SUP37015.1 Probable ATP-dependent Clp protease ATP-binding subunit [Tsukamurella paurometabola]